ncbi:SPOSA6832_05053 [Sporobolomyces salmonicolor]|uniref:SPOSA6832_05053-mRNA-1:cds n=1 Tax=Sporidiobolus salmonicolor TaxID=5005 RepID=A0A0D6ET84_SPOSA|nr:SPOSA6832_05053 [Sporobolomyces salmonicolor]
MVSDKGPEADRRLHPYPPSCTWTYHGVIQQNIPIYCTEVTYAQISAGFTYLVNKKAASGGGAVPSFEWHIMPNDQDWEICGVTITPIPVDEGPPLSPLICLGFLIDSSMLYISDASYIPEDTWNRVARCIALPTQTGLFPSSVRHLPRLQALIIDCTGLCRGPSHFGLPQAIATSRRLGAVRTYLTNLPHEHTHRSWLAFCDAFGRGARHSQAALANGSVGSAVPAWKVRGEFERQPAAAHVYAGLDPHVEDLELFVERTLEAVEEWAGGVLPGRWVRPLVDGMTVCWERDDDVNEWGRGRVWDDDYV